MSFDKHDPGEYPAKSFANEQAAREAGRSIRDLPHLSLLRVRLRHAYEALDGSFSNDVGDWLDALDDEITRIEDLLGA